MSNHALVQAKLIIKGKDYGAHPFLVPIRSLKDHTLLPGVVIRDQGPKQGAISMDNGYARFDNVRIPRENVSVFFTIYSEPAAESLFSDTNPDTTNRC
jgi:acyl-CoA oxidase